jgi:hypothetical protein
MKAKRTLDDVDDVAGNISVCLPVMRSVKTLSGTCSSMTRPTLSSVLASMA